MKHIFTALLLALPTSLHVADAAATARKRLQIVLDQLNPLVAKSVPAGSPSRNIRKKRCKTK